jgi:hypothetical protein
VAQTDVPFNPGNGHRPETLRAGDPGIEPDEFGEAIRLLIRSKLNDGRLPYDSMPRFWGGAGDGEQCDVCDTLITKEQLVMEGIASVFTSKKPVQFHVRCFYAWDAERRLPQS